LSFEDEDEDEGLVDLNFDDANPDGQTAELMANINQPILNADENNVQLVTEGTLNTNQDLLHLTNDNRYDHIKDPHVKNVNDFKS